MKLYLESKKHFFFFLFYFSTRVIRIVSASFNFPSSEKSYDSLYLLILNVYNLERGES